MTNSLLNDAFIEHPWMTQGMTAWRPVGAYPMGLRATHGSHERPIALSCHSDSLVTSLDLLR